jgi:prolipoprotein diacylglyceryl transferase
VKSVLTTLEFTPLLCLSFFALFFAITLVLARKTRPVKDALKAAFTAAMTFGLAPARDPEHADLFISGALATVTGVAPLVAFFVRGKPFEVPLASYPCALAVGFVAAIAIVTHRARTRGIDSAHVLDLAIICLIAGPVGSRIFFVAEFWDRYFADQPAQLVIGEAAPLTSSDELFLAHQDDEQHGSTVTVKFTGNETTLEDIQKSLSTLDASSRIRSHLVTLDRRKTGEEVVHQVRGLAIETEARGDLAYLQASGPAAEKLDLSEPARGKTIPLAEAFKIWNGGMVFYGGLALAAIACVVYIRARGYRLWLFADAVAPVLALGLAFGRVGCFLNGCCWGRQCEATFPFAVRFPVFSHPWHQHALAALSAAWDTKLEHARGLADLPPPLAVTDLIDGSHPVHPVQLYGIAINFLLFLAVLGFGSRFARREGQTFFFFLAIEPILRFVTEQFRGDNSQFLRLLGFAFSPGQLVALLTVPIGVAGFVWVSRRGEPVGTEVLTAKSP